MPCRSSDSIHRFAGFTISDSARRRGTKELLDTYIVAKSLYLLRVDLSTASLIEGAIHPDVNYRNLTPDVEVHKSYLDGLLTTTLKVGIGCSIDSSYRCLN